jgi:peptidoglycan/LPS O-acetylase OafA/YrhL
MHIAMGSLKKFTDKFKRVTYSGRYLPEIDGLRFIAIFLVVCFAHLGTYVQESVVENINQQSYIYRFLLEGTYGVSLFFIISGFILALPFAENKLLNGKPVVLKQYLWRRVTRLEPAYIITLVGYFILRVWFFKYESFNELLPHFFASLFYVHNIVYDAHSAVNGVAWSLEVEIQFYLLMPLLSYLYHIKNTVARRIIFLILVIGGIIFSYYQQYHIANFLTKGCYFFAGMLLADLYLLNKKDFSSNIYALVGAVFFIASLFIPGYYENVFYSILKIVLVVVFFFLAIKNTTLKSWLSYKPVAIIGGMCYSIYLLHIGVLGLLRHRFAKIKFIDNDWLNVSIHCICALAAILIVSGIFFLLVEKPTMKRDWYKHLFKKKAKS